MSLNIESRKTMYKFCLLLAEVWDPNCQTGASHQFGPCWSLKNGV